ncbi:DNA-directed RNA polymerase III complex subunit Rpc25, partial [Cryomyces antarcticus]
NAAERTWVWTTDGQEAFFDNHEVVRFRVEAENWHDLSPQQQPKPGDGEAERDQKAPYSII